MNDSSERRGFTCDRCSRCCREHRVPVTRAEVERWRNSGLLNEWPPELAFALVSPDEIDVDGEPESLAVVREGRQLLVLAHVPDETGTRCIFLKSEGCSIHAERPVSCRAYPFERPTAERKHLSLHPHAMCPPETGTHVTASLEATNDALSGAYVAWVTQRTAEASQHALFIQQWNRKQRTRLRLGRLAQTKAEFLHALVAGSRELQKNARTTVATKPTI